jgi:carboxypeptidase Taq
MKKSLDFIYKEQKELSTFGGIAALLGWDQMTYMPAKGAMERSEQSSLISRISHEKITSEKLWKHLQKLKDPNIFENLQEKDKAIVDRLEKDIEKARKIPKEFTEKMSKTTTLSYPAWQKALNKSDFSIFLPYLKEIVKLEREYCEYVNLPGPRYNSLIDVFEEGMTVDILKKEFSYLKSQLSKLLRKITTCEIYYKQQNLNKKFSIKQQQLICNNVLRKMKIPKSRSRIDVSTHPFTTSLGYDDIRITTNFEHSNPLFSFFSTIHEAGHALYELGMLKGEYKNTVISDSPSLGLHESQSRFWENMIARGRYFWNHYFHIFKGISPKQFNDLNIEIWYKYVNQVRPSNIRVEADELTYCLHIVLRFEIELDLIEDKIMVDELPYIWNEKMNEMLEITPKNDKEGVLQDMHWSGGSFGYFPTYAIGTIYAAQLFKKLSCDKSDINYIIEHGDFKNIIVWLREHIYRYGRLKTADEIIRNTCGEGLNSKIFVDYIKQKYCLLYEI